MIKIPPEKIAEDVYTILRTIFHYERISAEKFGMKIEESYVLLFLHRNPVVRVTDLSNELKLPMFTISRLVNRLVEDGYVTKEQDSSDKRNFFLHLDPKGDELLHKMQAFSYERITKNLSGMDDQQVKEILDLAGQLHVVLGVTKEVFH